ncbi:hypothetical protein AWC38_SpisGene7412 [Stylophora pistillata]|uniref:Uncharacterized protein n=2 Tax=Stylophora pistillata TaxID=50429 RepID=A0A2B4SFN3_STYPI|nr:hypothetical protein AWC38_SpisGene7412 [Stylophora pistillata]
MRHNNRVSNLHCLRGLKYVLLCFPSPIKTTNEETADHFHHVMNNVHPNLKFEIEKPETTPSGMSLSLLDFKVTISKDGNSSFEFYKKPAKKPLSVHYQSAIPPKSKLNFIRNERKRIEEMLLTYICNTTPKLIRLHHSPQRLPREQHRTIKTPTAPPKKLSTCKHRMVVPQDPIHF